MDTEELLLSTSSSEKPSCISLWDIKTTNSVFTYKSNNFVSTHLISQIGNDYLIAGNAKEPKLYLWEINNPDPTKKFRLILPDNPTCLCVCPQNIYLAVGIKTDLYIWQLSSGKLLTIQKKNYQPITVIKFSNCGSFLVVGGLDGLVITYRFFDLVCIDKKFLSQSNVGQVEPIYTKDHHNHPVTNIHMGNFGRKSRMATCSLDQTVKIYELLTGKLLLNLVFNHPVYTVIIDSPCWTLYAGCSSGNLQKISLINTRNVEINQHVDSSSLQPFIGHTKTVKTLSLNHSDTILASGGDDNFILIWDIISRQVLKKVDQNSNVTNLKFILNHNNILSQNNTPSVVLKELEMTLDLNENFSVTIIRNEEVIQDEDPEILKRKKMELIDENQYLRATNQQMYNFALKLLNKDL